MGSEKKRLLVDAEAGDAVGDALTVNAAFARAFEARKRKEELSRLDRRAPSDEDESTSESEDEDGEELTPELDADIRRTLRLIRRKDPAIYDPSIAFFEEKPGDDSEEEEAMRKPKKDAPLYYKDLVRRQVIAGDVDSEEDEPAPVKTFQEEQDALRKEFLASVDKADGSDEEGDAEGDGEGGLFKIRSKNADEQESDDDADLPTSKYGSKVKAAELDPDAFLEHYVSTEGWKDKTAAVPHYEDIVNDDEDAEELEKAENFEHAYNFRFEEDGGGEIQTHSRRVEDSMRRVDDSRKRRREERKARKALERQKKEEELRRLKNLKQAELEAKLEKVAKLMGEKSSKKGAKSEKERLAALADDLDADFDPEEYDKRMQAIFDEEYYQEDEADAGEIEKPTWDEEEDKALFAGLPVDPDDEDNDDAEQMELDEEDEKEEDDELEEEAGDAEEEEDEEEGDSDKDAEQDEENIAEMSVEEMQRAKQKYLDELYGLDYEDLIGDIKCRFKYKQVHTNDFGLTVDEIMAADDKELKQLVSLKRLAPYVENEYEVDRKKLKWFRKTVQEAREEKEEAKQAKAKRKAEAAEKEEAATAGAEEKPKKKRKRAKKTKAQESSAEVTMGDEGEEKEEGKESSKPEVKQDGKKKRRSKKKKGGDKAAALASTGLSTSRLESYKLLKSK